MRLGELEGVVGENDGYTAESDAAILLDGLDIPESTARAQNERAAGRPEGARAAGPGALRRARTPCCSTSPPTTSTSNPSTGCRISSPLPGHADRDLARPPLPEQRLHAHRRYRLPDDHHLHRRLRRHGAGEDADPLRLESQNAQREKKIAQLNEFIARFSAGTRRAR